MENEAEPVKPPRFVLKYKPRFTVLHLVNQIEEVGGKFVINQREVALARPEDLTRKQRKVFSRLEAQAHKVAY